MHQLSPSQETLTLSRDNIDKTSQQEELINIINLSTIYSTALASEPNRCYLHKN